MQGTFAWRIYEGVLATLKPILFTYPQAVAIAACEVPCHVAAIPSERVKNWESWLDSVENGAAWKNTARLLANQVEIIKLLKTPEGRRPGSGKEGY